MCIRDSSHSHIDRIDNILKLGIIAPGVDSTGTVIKETPVNITGFKYPYDELVFLHFFRSGISELYLQFFTPNRVTLILDGDLKVLQPSDMEERWLTLSQSEVYAHQSVMPQRITSIILQPEIIDSVIEEQEQRLRELDITVWDYEGLFYWSP